LEWVNRPQALLMAFYIQGISQSMAASRWNNFMGIWYQYLWQVLYGQMPIYVV